MIDVLANDGGKLFPAAPGRYPVRMAEENKRITEQDVRHVAKLSRLELTEEQVAQFTEQMEHVLEHIAKLNELDVADVEPMAHALDLTNVLRDDAEQAGLPVEAALANAPDKEPPFFKVPKVLGDGSSA